MKFFYIEKQTKRFSLFFYILLAGFSSVDSTPKIDLKQILEKIKQNSRDTISAFKGIDYKRNLVITETDPKTEDQILVSKILTRRVEYYYERPVVVVLSYEKNGIRLPPKEYEPEKSSPVYPIFDNQSDDHYSFQINGPILFQNKQSYVVEITPLQLSSRHFKGKIYYDKNTLHPFYIEGTTSKWKFGVKDMYFNVFMEMTKEKVPFVKSGDVFIKTYVPLLSSEKDIQIHIDTIEAVPIQK
ncbi:hypothetical protein AB3N59_17415 [Leptospira sp. WS92.C1]